MKNLIFGKKALFDHLKMQTIEKVYLNKPLNNLIDLIKQHNINYEVDENNHFFHQYEHVNHQGVIATIKNTQSKFVSFEQFLNQNKKEKSTILILDSIEDPHNFGSIIRTANGFGIDAIIYKKNNQVQLNETVNKVSTGASQFTNLFCVTNLNEAIKKLKAKQYWVYASALDQKSTSYYDMQYDQKTCLIVGNEKKGISELVLKNSDFLIHIPMYGQVQSFNVAIATGVILSEIIKQKHS